MRDNLCALLDDVGVQHVLGINSCTELFGAAKALVHYTSALRYPVFYRGANYSGSPSISRVLLLKDMVEMYLAEEASVLPRSTLWVPLGAEATKALEYLVEMSALAPDQILAGLPHPSAANQERVAVWLGRKSPTAVSVKTDPDRILRARDRLLEQVKRIRCQEACHTLNNSHPVSAPSPDPIPLQVAPPPGSKCTPRISEADNTLGENAEGRLVAAAIAQGYRVTNQTKKKLELTHEGSNRIVYIDRTRAASAGYALILHPETPLESLRRITLAEVPEPGRYFHSSNLRKYPKRTHRGKNAVSYGYSIFCESLNAAVQVLQMAHQPLPNAP